mmetsp:Transcript_74966/g.148971  ORF Transcript_74966/g.148971 Transcript_74966/m.148971 type:complete len:237 (-) Transcript_74966:36-746(-)
MVAGLAQRRHNTVCPGEILLRRVRACRHDTHHLGCFGCLVPNARILNNQALSLVKAHCLGGKIIHIWRWLLHLDGVATEEAEFGVALRAHQHLHQCAHGRLIACRAYSQRHITGNGFVYNPQDTRAQRDSTSRDELLEKLRLPRVAILDERKPCLIQRKPFRRRQLRGCWGFASSRPAIFGSHVRCHSLLTAAHLAQSTILFDAPFEAKALFLEHRVEAHAVAIPFGISEDTITVK